MKIHIANHKTIIAFACTLLIFASSLASCNGLFDSLNIFVKVKERNKEIETKRERIKESETNIYIHLLIL